MQLEICRLEIDEIDKKILALLNKRADVAKKIGVIKAQAGLPVIDPERENEVLRRVTAKNEGCLGRDSIVKIFRTIIRQTRLVQIEGVSEYLKKGTEIGQ